VEDLVGSISRGHHERSLLCRIARVHVRAGLKQLLHHGGHGGVHGQVQQRSAGVIAGVGIEL